MKDFFPGTKGAVISPCDTFRYALWRIWSPSEKLLMAIGLNPSKADAVINDATIRRLIDYAVRWGFGGLLMGNIFAWRGTYPHSLTTVPDRIGPDNDLWLGKMRDRSSLHLACWGNNAEIDPDRIVAVRSLFPALHYLRLTQTGNPHHPLRLPKTLEPIKWEVAA